VIFSLVYVSRAAASVTHRDLLDLMVTSTTANADVGSPVSSSTPTAASSR